MSREYTEEEVRSRFLTHCWHIVNEWNVYEDGDCRKKISGAVFSVLAALDGSSIGIPAFIVAPQPCPGDKEDYRSLGEGWYPENHELNVKGDIGGSLHELFFQYDPDKESVPLVERKRIIDNEGEREVLRVKVEKWAYDFYKMRDRVVKLQKLNDQLWKDLNLYQRKQKEKGNEEATVDAG